MKRALAILLVAASASCSGESFDPPSLVDSLRVLAVRADLPFARPGERVHLDALAVDPLGGGRAVQFAWGTCVNPGSAEVPACAAAVPSFAIGGPTFDLTVPPDALQGLPASLPIGSVGVVFAACAGSLRAGRTDTAPISCVDDRGASSGRDGFMWGEKRVTVTTDLRNANPRIAAITLDGVPWDPSSPPAVAACGASAVADCAPNERHAIAVRADPGSAESYLGLTEDLVAYFFVSQGRVDNDYVRAQDGSFTVTFAAIKVDPSRPILVWVVLRDDRGGVDWVTRSLSVH